MKHVSYYTVMEIADEVDEHDDTITWACTLLDKMVGNRIDLDEAVIKAWFAGINEGIDGQLATWNIPVNFRDACKNNVEILKRRVQKSLK